MSRLVHGYIRVSTEDQADGGLSLETQRDLIRKEYERTWKPQGFEFGRVYEDRAISAKKPLRSRPAGMQLNLDVQPGDVILFSRMDRGFRDVKDILTTMDIWESGQVRAVFMDMNIDYGTPIGKLMLTVYCAGAAFEREQTASRTREVMAHARRQGKRIGRPPFGVRMSGPKDKRVMSVIPEELEVGRAILRWRLEGFTWEAIEAHLKKNSILRPAARSGRNRGLKRRWSNGSIRRAHLGTLKVERWIAEGKLREPQKVG